MSPYFIRIKTYKLKKIEFFLPLKLGVFHALRQAENKCFAFSLVFQIKGF